MHKQFSFFLSLTHTFASYQMPSHISYADWNACIESACKKIFLEELWDDVFEVSFLKMFAGLTPRWRIAILRHLESCLNNFLVTDEERGKILWAILHLVENGIHAVWEICGPLKKTSWVNLMSELMERGTSAALQEYLDLGEPESEDDEADDNESADEPANTVQ